MRRLSPNSALRTSRLRLIGDLTSGSSTLHQPQNPSHAHWKLAIGKPLADLAEAAGYSPEDWIKHEEFFTKYCMNYLGNAPYDLEDQQRWKSFMTDNHCPVELSWDWGRNDQAPKIRYSMEPIGPTAGRSDDSPNRTAGARLLTAFHRDGYIPDMQLVAHFWKHLVIFDGNLQQAMATNADHSSQFFFGFDLVGDKTTIKAYFLPHLKASARQSDSMTLITNAMRDLPGFDTELKTQLDSITTYMTKSEAQAPIEIDIFAIDCVLRADARYKIYMRCRDTTFGSVKNVMTLGGYLQSDSTDKSLEKLHQLWKELFPGQDEETSRPLHQNNHRTAGILYNFEIRPGRNMSVPKIYLPVRHYCENDERVAHTITNFNTRLMNNHASEETNSAYMRSVSKLSVNGGLADTRGLHTYVSCTLEKDTIKLISYINPCANTGPSSID